MPEPRIERLLPLPAGYDPARQVAVALLAAALDDQSARLKKAVQDLAPEELAWQRHPGMNTIGMLLAHIAIAEVYCLMVPGSTQPPEGAESHCVRILGVDWDDDGMPLARDGAPPEGISGKPVEFFLALLDKARAETHRVMRAWEDSDLDKTVTRSWEETTYVYTLRWLGYHALEHLSGHLGQIQLLKHLKTAAP